MISFIVPAHNEEALIGRTLAALRDSAECVLNEPYEIVVVDDYDYDCDCDCCLAFKIADIMSALYYIHR